MNGTMKWFIVCAVIIAVCSALLIGLCTGFVIHYVDSEIADYHKANLLIIYDIKLE